MMLLLGKDLFKKKKDISFNYIHIMYTKSSITIEKATNGFKPQA